MVSATHFLTFAVLAFLLVIVPGPSVLFTIGRALTVGRRDALLTVVGNAVGVYLQVVAIAFGVGTLVMTSVGVFTAVKLCGAGYLIYLGVQAIRHRRKLTDALSRRIDETRRSTPLVLRDGFIVGFANPKTIVFFAALLPQFVNLTAGSVPLQMMQLGICVPVYGLVFDSMWALIASVTRDWFAGSPRRLAVIGGAGGVVLIGLGASLALTGRKD